jgi:C4-dicarboxylate-specific signal transduction histidine kinase
VRVSSQQGKVLLDVEDSGPSVVADALDALFNPFAAATRPGENSLERAACWSIARRLEAKLHAAARPEGGLSVTVEFSSAT